MSTEVAFNHVHAAATLNKLHEKFLKSLKTSVESAIEIGLMLEQVKKDLPHGQFLPWIDKNLEFKERTAQDYMRISKNQKLISDTTTVSEALTILRPEKKEVAVEAYVMDDKDTEETEAELPPPKPLKEVKKIDGAFWYWADVNAAAEYLDKAYDKLKKKRTNTTPLALGRLIGNVKAMSETLKTWDPRGLRVCEFCNGTGKIDENTICSECINGKSGVSRATNY